MLKKYEAPDMVRPSIRWFYRDMSRLDRFLYGFSIFKYTFGRWWDCFTYHECYDVTREIVADCFHKSDLLCSVYQENLYR